MNFSVNFAVMKIKCSLHVDFFIMEFGIFCFQQYILMNPLLSLKPEGCFSGQKHKKNPVIT